MSNIDEILAQCDDIERTCKAIKDSLERSIKDIRVLIDESKSEPNRLEYNDADGAEINRQADKYGRD